MYTRRWIAKCLLLMALILPYLQVLTQRLLAANGVKASLEEVTAKFEELYQGTDTVPGLCATERLIVPKVGRFTCHGAKQAHWKISISEQGSIEHPSCTCVPLLT